MYDRDESNDKNEKNAKKQICDTETKNYIIKI
jgi:hypothetical protein